MLRNRAVQLMFCLLGLMIATPAFASSGLAESTVTVTGGFTTADAGVFTVGLTAKPDSGCAGAPTGNPGFGPFIVDAVGVSNGFTPQSIDFCVLYTDTQAQRGPFLVQLSIASFELKADQIPTFDGAADAHFQIPNRFLVLSTIGQVTGGSVGAGVGAVSDVQADAGGAFASGPLKIASVAQGTGSGAPKQELTMTLNIPAGVYPGEYDSTITVETYTGP